MTSGTLAKLLPMAHHPHKYAIQCGGCRAILWTLCTDPACGGPPHLVWSQPPVSVLSIGVQDDSLPALLVCPNCLQSNLVTPPQTFQGMEALVYQRGGV